MTLRVKTILILSVTIAGLLLAANAASDRILLRKILDIEQNDTRDDLERLSQWVSGQMAGMSQTAADWSYWDDMYQFADDLSGKFITANLTDDAMVTIDLSLLAVIGPDGSLVFVRACDRKTGKQEEGGAKHFARYLKTAPNIALKQGEEPRQGLAILDGKPMLFAASPILTSERKGPIRGTLVMGRYFDAAMAEDLSEAVRMKVNLRLFDEMIHAPLFAAGRGLGKDGNYQRAMVPVDEYTLMGYVRIPDSSGGHSLVIEAAIPRTIYQQGRQSISYFNWALMTVGLICATAMLLLLEKSVLSRLARLSRDVSRIGESDDLSLRLEVKGRDEIAGLAARVNATLSKLDESRKTQEHNRVRMERSRDFYLRILDDFPNPIWHSDVTGTRSYFNKAWLSYRGRTLQQEFGDGWAEGLRGDDAGEYLRTYDEARKARQPFTTEYGLRRGNGECGWMLEYGRPIYDAEGAFAGYIGSCYDVTDRKKMEEALVGQSRALAKQVRRSESIIHTAIDGYLTVGLDGKIREINRAFCDIVGYSREELLGMNLDALELKESRGEIAGHMAIIVAKGQDRFETRYRKKDGNTVDLEMSVNVVRDGADTFFVAFAHDVTERVMTAKRLAYMAETDQLTGIRNRRSFFETMNMLEEKKKLCASGFAFVMCDVDDFKMYNDTYGHIQGDEVLAQVASSIFACLRAGDMLFRYGGEEFVMLLPGTDAKGAEAVAARICAAVEKMAIPHSAGARGVVTVSCGASTCAGGGCNRNGKGWEEVLRRADTALYIAKREGKNRAVLSA